MKISLMILIATILICCKEKPMSIANTNNPNFKLELLFEADGCKIYRFVDGGRYVYWSNCNGQMQSIHDEGSGKSRHTVIEQSINTNN